MSELIVATFMVLELVVITLAVRFFLFLGLNFVARRESGTRVASSGSGFAAILGIFYFGVCANSMYVINPSLLRHPGNNLLLLLYAIGLASVFCAPILTFLVLHRCTSQRFLLASICWLLLLICLYFTMPKGYAVNGLL